MAAGQAFLHVLGPIALTCDGVEVALPARQHRRLLAAFAVAAGAARSRDQLVDALWGEEPPRSADKVLQQYVSQLRRIAPDLPMRTIGAGYALELEPGGLDAGRFEQLLGEAREALRADAPAAAAALLRQALQCWRGGAYGEFAGELFAAADADRLENLRRDAVEDRVEADLALGRHADVLSEVRALAAADPLRERLQALAMVALYRAGLQAEALGVYRVARDALVDELGVEPGATLRDVHRRVLAQDASLAEPTIGPAAATLPPAINPLRGRDRELAELTVLLRSEDVRLLVLTGAGGSGKTRLAVEAARAAAPGFAHGAVFVELADVRDPAQLLPALCARLGVVRQAADPLTDLAAALRARELLLVLDNLEQLRAAGPVLVALLRDAPRLRLLVTSRVVLHVSGEHVYPVDPLDGEAADALFRERARESDTRATGADPATVRRLCARLDGLPLAIELAAARLRSLTANELLARLDARLPVLAGGPTDLPARQQTLAATVAWSHDLLEPGEQVALARLSVFAGRFSLAAAEAVCEVTLDVLARLVDSSLLTRTVVGGGSRYGMLETVREFAEGRLLEMGGQDEVRRRHAQHFHAVATAYGLSVEAICSGVPHRHAAAVAEWPDLRAALDWAAVEEPRLALELALQLEQHWIVRNPREGATRISALLRTDGLPPELTARAHRDLGGSLQISGDVAGATEHYEASLALYRQMGDELGVLRLEHRLATTDMSRGDWGAVRRRVDAALPRARAADHATVEIDLLGVLADLAFVEERMSEAYDLALEVLTKYRHLGGWPWGEALTLAMLAEVAGRLGQVPLAEQHACEALTLSVDLGDRINVVSSLAVLATVALAAHDEERAGVLWGAVEAEEQRAFLGRWEEYREEYAAQIAAATGPALERGRARGRGLRVEAAVAYALA